MNYSEPELEMQETSSGRKLPPYFMRYVKITTSFAETYVRLSETGYTSKKDVEQLVELMFGSKDSKGKEWSVFGVENFHRFDEAHALGLIAVTINSKNLDEKERSKFLKRMERRRTSYEKKKQPKQDDLSDHRNGKRNSITVIFPSHLLNNESVQKSPQNNLAFVAADDIHYDIRSDEYFDREQFVEAFQESLTNKEVLPSFLNLDDYYVQASVAFSSCIKRFGVHTLPSREAHDPRDSQLPPNEQLARLRHLAGDTLYRHPVV